MTKIKPTSPAVALLCQQAVQRFAQEQERIVIVSQETDRPGDGYRLNVFAQRWEKEEPDADSQ